MNPGDTGRRGRELAAAADLPQGFDPWSGVLARLPQVRRRRTAVRAAVAAVAALAVVAAVTVPLTIGAPASAAAAARRAAAAARTGAGLPPVGLTEAPATTPGGVPPQPPPPPGTQHSEHAGPARRQG